MTILPGDYMVGYHELYPGKGEGTIWENVRKCHGCKGQTIPALHTDHSTQYVLVGVESDGWFAVSRHQKYKS